MRGTVEHWKNANGGRYGGIRTLTNKVAHLEQMRTRPPSTRCPNPSSYEWEAESYNSLKPDPVPLSAHAHTPDPPHLRLHRLMAILFQLWAFGAAANPGRARVANADAPVSTNTRRVIDPIFVSPGRGVASQRA